MAGPGSNHPSVIPWESSVIPWESSQVDLGPVILSQLIYLTELLGDKKEENAVSYFESTFVRNCHAEKWWALGGGCFVTIKPCIIMHLPLACLLPPPPPTSHHPPPSNPFRWEHPEQLFPSFPYQLEKSILTPSFPHCLLPKAFPQSTWLPHPLLIPMSLLLLPYLV